MRYIIGINGEVQEVEATSPLEAAQKLGLRDGEVVVLDSDGTPEQREMVAAISKDLAESTLQKLLESQPTLDDLTTWGRKMYPVGDLIQVVTNLNAIRHLRDEGLVEVKGNTVLPTGRGMILVREHEKEEGR